MYYLPIVPRRLDRTLLRYVASFASILIGGGLLLFVFLHDGGGGDLSSVDVGPTPTPLPQLVKGTPADCPNDWRFLDNTVQRFTICLPKNLFYYDGARGVSPENATADDLRGFLRNFILINDGWVLPPPEEAPGASDVLAPLNLLVESVAPAFVFDGCDLRREKASDRGVVICDDFLRNEDSGVEFTPEGRVHRYKGLVPIQHGKTVNESFSLFLIINSRSIDWPMQEPLFGLILASLKPY